MANSRIIEGPPSVAKQSRLRRIAARLATLLSVLVVASILLEQTAMPVVMDMRAPIVFMSIIAAAMFAIIAMIDVRRSARRLYLVATVSTTALAAWFVNDMFLRYTTEDVEFSVDGTTLRGTLYVPRSGEVHPGIVLIHGAGAETRHEYGFYARAYARRGVAALAYDKRGSGKSEGDNATATFEQLAADAVAAMQLMRSRPNVAADRVGFWALSEGEWVAPLAAATADPAFMVLVSAAAMTPSEQVQYETGANVKSAGYADQDIREARALYAALARFQRNGHNRDSLNEALANASRKPWFDAAENLDSSVPEYSKVQQIGWFPAWRTRMDFDALPLLQKGDYPVLALSGGRDPQNDGRTSLDRLQQAVGAKRFTGAFYPTGEHGMIAWPIARKLPPPFFAGDYLDRQLDWVATVVKQPR